MSSSVILKKGFDIKLEGAAQKVLSSLPAPLLYALRPPDFPGLIPKLNVKPGDKVLAGTPLFHDKLRPEILFTSPVSGKVTAINRGDRRTLLEVVVEKSGGRICGFRKI